MQALSTTATVTVTIEDENEPPTIGAQERNIAENSAVGSQLLPALVYEDPDDGDSATLTIHDGNDGTAFELVGGVLKVKNSGPLDYEARASFSLVIRATDGAGLHSDAHITVCAGAQGLSQRASAS